MPTPVSGLCNLCLNLDYVTYVNSDGTETIAYLGCRVFTRKQLPLEAFTNDYSQFDKPGQEWDADGNITNFPTVPVVRCTKFNPIIPYYGGDVVGGVDFMAL